MYYRLHDYIEEAYRDEFSSEPAPIREALIFKKTVESMPLQIKETDYIAGWYGYETCPCELADFKSTSVNTACQEYLSGSDVELKTVLDDKICSDRRLRPGAYLHRLQNDRRKGREFIYQQS